MIFLIFPSHVWYLHVEPSKSLLNITIWDAQCVEHTPFQQFYKLITMNGDVFVTHNFSCASCSQWKICFFVVSTNVNKKHTWFLLIEFSSFSPKMLSSHMKSLYRSNIPNFSLFSSTFIRCVHLENIYHHWHSKTQAREIILLEKMLMPSLITNTFEEKLVQKVYKFHFYKKCVCAREVYYAY